MMENHKLVLPEHLNHYGYLFGGYLLQWVDEYAWIAATLEYPGCGFVTVAMDRVEFKKSVQQGTILKFVVQKSKQGLTSVQYEVNVYTGGLRQDQSNGSLFSTHVTLVRIDENGQKMALPA